ncbi:MAG: winged helix-turn-helix domain-containing protein [Myxococcota bacterium]
MDPSTGDAGPRTLSLIDGVVDIRNRTIERSGRERLLLTNLEADLLAYLAERTEPVPVQRLLTDVWGYHARSRSRAPYTTIQRLRKKIEVEPREPRHLRSIFGQGYVFVGARFGGPDQGNRSADGASDEHPLHQAFSRARLVTVIGPPGIGKSRLTLDYFESQPGAACRLVNLGDVNEEEVLADRLGSTYGLTEIHDLSTMGRAMDLVGPHTLVLDDAEAMVPMLHHHVERWLFEAPAMRIVVTSRRRLALADEHLHRVGPLDLDEATTFLERCIQRTEGVAAAVNADRDALRRLARALDGIPLSLEMAASRLVVFSLQQLNHRLPNDTALLRGPSRGRFESVDEAVDWSWRNLKCEEQAALAQCSLFRGQFDLTAAERIVDCGSVPVVDVMQSLVEHSLITRTPSGGFVLLHPVRQRALRDLRAEPVLWRETEERHRASEEPRRQLPN